MLIDSPRLTDQDRNAWHRLEHYDALIAGTTHLAPLIAHSFDVIRGFAETGRCYCSTSWGKDSTVLVDLAMQAAPDTPVVMLRVDGYEPDGTDQVRDAMLNRWPAMRYDELTLPPQQNRWWDDDAGAQSKWRADIGWRTISKRYGSRRMTGIRAEESRLRTMVMGRWGDASDNACRPIGRWKATDVFAYLHREQLPVHPAYAMSHGGALDRRWLRVHNLGGVTGSDRGRADWEAAYYGDQISDARRRDAAMADVAQPHTAAELAAVMPVPTTPDQMSRVLDRMTDRGLTIHASDMYTRTTTWPLEPHWLAQGDES